MNEFETILSELRNKTLKKKVLVKGDFSINPLEGAECEVKISDVTWKSEPLDNVCRPPDENSVFLNSDFNGKLIIGRASLYIDIDLERCMQHMYLGETSIVSVTYFKKTGDVALEVSCKLEILKIGDPGLFCDWHWAKKVTSANQLKESGVELIKNNRIIDAFRHFSKALKYILSLDKFDFKAMSEDDKEEVTSLRLKLYNNVAHCQLQFNEFQAVVSLCDKILTEDPANVKALYRRGTAHMGLTAYEVAYADICQVLTIEPKNSAAQQKAVILREKVININEAYKKVIKNMFNSH